MHPTQSERKEKGCFVRFGQPFPELGEETSGADGARRAIHAQHCRYRSLSAGIPRLLLGPHWCHAGKMCSWLEFGSLASGGEGASLLTEGAGAVASGLRGEGLLSSGGSRIALETSLHPAPQP